MLTPLFQAVGLPTAYNSKSDGFERLVASKIRDGYITAVGFGEKLHLPPGMRETREWLLEHGWKFRDGFFHNDKKMHVKRLRDAVIERGKQATALKAAADVRIKQIQETARQGELLIPQAEIDTAMNIARNDFNANRKSLGLDVEWSDEIASSLMDGINENYRKNFAGFTEKQGDEIRQWVHEAYIGGNLTKKSAADYFAHQYDISRQRAKFWARQELSMLVGELKREQMNAAGYRYYIWHTVGDSKVRDDHVELDGTLQDTYDPPVIDIRTGRRGNPKMDFNCRCYAEYITEDEYNERKNFPS